MTDISLDPFKPVSLNGHIDVPQNRLEQVRAALPCHIDLTRAEAGCLKFQVIESNTVPGQFLVSEIFENQAAFDAHQQRTKTSDWAKVTQGLLRDYTIIQGDAS